MLQKYPHFSGCVAMGKKDYDIEALPYHCKKIARRIGVENLFKISEEVGGEYIFIPKRENLLKYLQQKWIREDRAAGMTLEQIAKKHNISVPTVRRKLKK